MLEDGMYDRDGFVCTLMSTVLCAGMVSPATGKTVRPTGELIGPWQLFIDDHVVAEKRNVQRRYHAFRKDPRSPLIVVDKPWEANVVNGCTVLPGEDGNGFRMYYYCWTPKDDASRSYMCYATSEDGITWVKPDLGLHTWKGDGTTHNNITPNGCAAVIPTPWETDPLKKYHGVGGQYHARVSPDGIRWTPLSEEKIVSGGDTSHFYWDARTEKFRCNVKVVTEVSGLRRRCVGFSETTDLTRYPPLRMVMAPDDQDDRWCKPGSVERTHFYACPVFNYETMYLGFLQIYRAEDPEGYFHGPLWLELVSSRDGVHWLREEGDRPPLLDIGKFRTFDFGMVISPPPLAVGDEIWIYYSGYDDLHDLLPYHSAIGLAKLRKDGFASLDADEAPGEMVTRALADVEGTLLVNCDARRGSVKVEVLDDQMRVIPGYGREACAALSGREVRQAVAWGEKRTLPTDRGPVRLRFLLEHAQLYSFMAGENASVIEEPTPPALEALFTFEGGTDGWSDLLWADGVQTLRNLGTCRLDYKQPDPAFGKRSLVVGSEWRPLNRVEIEGTRELGRRFTLAAMVKSTNRGHARLFSAYNGNYPTNTTELIFDFDPRGRVLNGMRLICKGIRVESDALMFADGKYHHLAVTFDDGEVTFYLDGAAAGQAWLPGGEPVRLERNLMIGEDANLGSDEQLMGNVDDVLVLGRVLKAEELAALATKGAAAFFDSRN